MSDTIQRQYELTVLISPQLAPNYEATLGQVEAVVAKLDGKVVSKEVWGEKRLAYVIRKQDKAYFVCWLLDLPPLAAYELEKKLALVEGVMRTLLVRKEVTKIKAKTSKK